MKGEQKMYEVFEQLLQKYGVTPYKVSKSTGVTQASLSKWKTGESVPSSKTLQKVADFFGVTVDYLMTGKEPEEKEPTLTPKDERDISKRLEKTLEDLENSQEALMFDGVVLDENTKELLKASLENSLRIAKIHAKEKFTPKKYRNTK